jgi:hypothetical protein
VPQAEPKQESPAAADDEDLQRQYEEKMKRKEARREARAIKAAEEQHNMFVAVARELMPVCQKPTSLKYLATCPHHCENTSNARASYDYVKPNENVAFMCSMFSWFQICSDSDTPYSSSTMILRFPTTHARHSCLRAASCFARG